MKPGDRVPFRAAHETVGDIDSNRAALLAAAVGDVAVVLDSAGRILDVSFSKGDPLNIGADQWINRPWSELFTGESTRKLEELVSDAVAGAPPRWRQVNHVNGALQVPFSYLALGTGDLGHILAIGQDQRAVSAMQQKLIQAQQAIERDYQRLRQTEIRYRLMFDLDHDPVFVIEADTRRIKEANPAATAAMKAKPGALVNRPFSSVIDPAYHDAVLTYFGIVSAADGADPLVLDMADNGARVTMTATPFRQDRVAYFLVRMRRSDDASGELSESMRVRDLLELMPDGFVLVDERLSIVAANPSFLDLAQEASLTRLKGMPLGDYLGRAGIDVDLIVDQMREHGLVRNLSTIVRGRNGAIEDVELSGVAAPEPHGGFGFTLRSVPRTVREAQPADRDLPRSVEQLTELVGRMSLKDIVRESTDLIERLCIEAALDYTSDNRASAAEILGVSRQSLYSKLHRHGLGNLVPEEE